MPPLQMSSGGGGCFGVANDTFISLVTNKSGRIVHYVVGVLRSLTTHYDGHSHVKEGGPSQSEVVTDTPKDLLVACFEVNHASLTNQCLTRPAIWTAPDPRSTHRVTFMSSSSTTQRKDYQGILALGTSATLYRVQYNVGRSQTRDRKPRYSKQAS